MDAHTPQSAPAPPILNQIETELLVLNAQSGSDEALAALVSRWSSPLRTRALKLTQSQDAADEITQSTWLAIAKGIRSLRDPARFPAWSMRIVHHHACDWIRHRSRDRGRTAPATTDQLCADSTTNPDQQTLALTRRAIARLEPKLRDVVLLYYLDSLTINQIAAALDTRPGTIKTRLMRARKQLRSTLERTTQ